MKVHIQEYRRHAQEILLYDLEELGDGQLGQGFIKYSRTAEDQPEGRHQVCWIILTMLIVNWETM